MIDDGLTKIAYREVENLLKEQFEAMHKSLKETFVTINDCAKCRADYERDRHKDETKKERLLYFLIFTVVMALGLKAFEMLKIFHVF